MRISTVGTNRILDCLKKNQVKATFFCTANFALHSQEVMQRIVAEGHEVASHGYHHWTFEVSDLKKSKEVLEQLIGKEVKGYRQARMMPVPEKEIRKAGYVYNSSLNPTFIPGRYMHLSTPRTCFMKEDVLQIPASVTPGCVSRCSGCRITTFRGRCTAGCADVRMPMTVIWLLTFTLGSFMN